MAIYPFESPLSFMADFAVTATLSGDWSLDGKQPTLDSDVYTLDGSGILAVFPVILSEPGQDIMGGEILSNQYEIEYITSNASLEFGTAISIQSINFKVLNSYQVDDGTFSRARLQT